MGIACSQDASVPTSTTWDRYEKIRILGQGASASVWLARPKKGAAGMQSVMPVHTFQFMFCMIVFIVIVIVFVILTV
jgi:hypothetical protein